MSFFVCYCSLIFIIIYILGYWPCATRPSAHISIFTISLFFVHFCAVKPNNNNNNKLRRCRMMMMKCSAHYAKVMTSINLHLTNN